MLLPEYTMCSWSESLINIFESMNSTNNLTTPLPFVSADVWTLLDKSLLSPIYSVHTTSCHSTDFSLDMFRNLLLSYFTNQFIGVVAVYDNSSISVTVSMKDIDVSYLTR